jgi:hypothetical protein
MDLTYLFFWMGRPHHFHTLESQSNGVGIKNNHHLDGHEHETRDFIEPRGDDLIQLDGKAVANAIRKWVREHHVKRS